MIVFDITGKNEEHPVYRELARTNGIRHYNFLDSIISTSLQVKHFRITETLVRSINFHAIACLHEGAGEYRNIPVTVGDHRPMPWEDVPKAMEIFVDSVNHSWEKAHPLVLTAFAMWQINWIHPFVNGNGRAARAIAYYILCMKYETRVPVQLPELIRSKYRDRYIEALMQIDNSHGETVDLAPLVKLIESIINEAIRQMRENQHRP